MKQIYRVVPGPCQGIFVTSITIAAADSSFRVEHPNSLKGQKEVTKIDQNPCWI